MSALASWIAGAARLLAGVTVRAGDFIPDGRPRLYFANHTSHLDAVVLWSVLPEDVRRRTRPVAAADYWNRSRLRRFLAGDVFRAVLIDRDPARRTGDPVGEMLAVLEAGDSLIIFPEGTRGSGERIAEFKSGIYHLAARRPGLELIPVHMENLNRILPKGELMPVPLLSSVTFGPPLALAPDEAKAAFLARARAALVVLGGAP